MGKPTGFMEYSRKVAGSVPPGQRLEGFYEFKSPLDRKDQEEQGARCMDCGVPFCQSDYGCPVDNLIPEWNDLIYHGRWEEAFYRLMKTNNFPEYTGRVCPAPCEHACVLAMNDPAVTIKENEAAIIDWGYEAGLMTPRIPAVRTGKSVAIVGSGPAGLAAADQLNQAGHQVTMFERADRPGGLLMYGIPAMKLDKKLVQRRNNLLQAEGVIFRTGVDVGRDVSLKELQREYDAVLLACGATKPRDLPVAGRDLSGVTFAMDYLTLSTRRVLDSSWSIPEELSAQGKRVVVIGGGDTGNDCLGTALRQGCSSVLNLEILPQPPLDRTREMPWPAFARTLKSDYGHEEASATFGDDPRLFSRRTLRFVGDKIGRLRGVETIQVRWEKEPGETPRPVDLAGTEEVHPADMVLLALGFVGPEEYLVGDFPLDRDGRGNFQAEEGHFLSSKPGIFVAGDARRGQSLVVWAIKEGRGAAREIDRYLMGFSELP
ncbi:glutamate synthase (NADH) small subunit [Alkalispirochaeta americana]|uniref:Glutamate synthase (NADH) small subunit n=1 Tax=Alkalispirochaeta americana TaxID=159291 RepID=A0A1N6R183_9SPIO|nr:glutamate synthase subunit beta [Alkalispirochaeta americana]SIQ22549.1 glutamate synthase (NADH) small subunit [Alkalispirochaeta americana]